MAKSVCTYVGGSDSSAYYNAALLFGKGQFVSSPRRVPGLSAGEAGINTGLYLPLGFRAHDGGQKIIPAYPIGLSLMMTAVARVSGWISAPGCTAAIHMILGLVVTYWLCLQFRLAGPWGYAVCVLLACSPLYLFMGLQPMSDQPSLVWCTGAIVAIIESLRRPRFAAMAGIAFSVAVLLRPANVILFLPLMFVGVGELRRLLYFGVGAVPLAVLSAVYNHFAFGSAFATGYGNMASAFSADSVLPTMSHYCRWLPILFTPIALAGFLLPVFRGYRDRRTLILIFWPLSFLLFYAFYAFTKQSWWYLRFVLPAAPGLLVAGAVCMRTIVERVSLSSSRAAYLGVTAVCVALLAFALRLETRWNRRFEVLKEVDASSFYRTAEWLNRNAPSNAVVASMQSSGSIYAYTAFAMIRWDNATDTELHLLDKVIQKNHWPLYAIVYPFEKQQAFERLKGKWHLVFSYDKAGVYLRDSADGSDAIR